MISFKTKDIASIAVFTSLVSVATISINLYVPATRGYFNIGETMVYTTSILMGPLIGGFAGGVGSMLADVALGFNVYAPGTLIIKGIEGFIVGYVARYGFKSYSKKTMSLISLITGFILAFILWWGGNSSFVGEIGITFGIEPNSINLVFNIPSFFWILISLVSFIVIFATTQYFEPQINWIIYSILLGGAEMILGYYLYQTLILGQVLALTEVIVNIGQVIIGLLVAVPLSRSILRLLPITNYLTKKNDNK